MEPRHPERQNFGRGKDRSHRVATITYTHIEPKKEGLAMHHYLLLGEAVDSSSESAPPWPAVLEASRCASSSRDGKRV